MSLTLGSPYPGGRLPPKTSAGVSISAMRWARISVEISDDPKVHELAIVCAVRPAEAVGLIVGVFTHMAEHAQTGALIDVPDGLIERWALWQGDPGVFAQPFRRLFCRDDGVVTAWEKHNGAAIRESLAARLRMADKRNKRKRLQGVRRTKGEPFGERSPTNGTVVPSELHGGGAVALNGTAPSVTAVGKTRCIKCDSVFEASGPCPRCHR